MRKIKRGIEMKSKPREVDPFKNKKDIEKMKQYLKGKDNLRDYTIFVVGINVGLRAGDLLSLKWADVLNENGTIKDNLLITEEKTGKTKELTLNNSVKDALSEYLKSLQGLESDYVFSSRKGNEHLQVRSLHRIIKQATRDLNIKGNYGTHSLRKTFGYHRYKAGIPLETLQKMFNHSSQAITLKYIGITKEVIQDAYKSINL